jgi:multiple sugar transport system ATP-binding protein
MGRLEIDGLTKVFGDGDERVTAVNNLDIDIKDGEFIVLVGPSGCGKSTTLRCTAGLETASDGRIVLNGEDVTDKKPKNREMAMVFQNYALYPHMTARENMAFGLKMATDLPEQEIAESVNDAAEMMDITELLDDRPSELSGGQQQRVALGRAIVREPEVFLMDEPLSNLDAKLRTSMRTELQELQERLGITTIYVTHDQTEAMTMGDRIAVLNDGRLQQIGTPLECYHRPTNRFVASFIGSPSMNFMEVVHSDGTLHHDKFDYDLSTETATQLASAGSDRLIMGVRPEDVRTVSGSERNAIGIRLRVTEPLGDTTYAYFELGEKTYTMEMPGDQIINEGDELTIQFPEDRIHLFDGDTEEALKNRKLRAEDEAEWSASA